MDSLLFAFSAASIVFLEKKQKQRQPQPQQQSGQESRGLLIDNHDEDSSNATSFLQKALQDGTSLDAKERVCTVVSGKENIPTSHGHLRSEMRLQNLWHRATYILVKHSPAHDDRNTGSVHDVMAQRILVQKRSQLKDYCPGKLDPTPGGVVGYGETYEENAIREIQEEMGIDVSDGNECGNQIQRLFTFQYSDDHVNVWGDFYECTYKGRLQDIKIQPSEVEQIISMTIGQLEDRILSEPHDFMPDSCYALRLYLQRLIDQKVKRRLLKGYSSGDLDNYAIRPKPKVVFFDCDDTLYFDGWKTANQLTAKIEKWCTEKVGLPKGKAYQLYKQHGTALRGLLAEGYIDNNPQAIDQFLKEVHDIPIHELLQPDKELRQILLQIDPTVPKYIFTASVSHHAERCLKALGIDDLFEKIIIDVKSCNLETKHNPKSFQVAMKIAGVPADEPEACLFLDDNLKNIQAAREIGWRSVLVGTVGRDCNKRISSDDAELEVEKIHDIPSALPELFDGMN